MSPLLEVRDLAVCFSGTAAALRGVDLRVDRGASLAVVGESGSGKSTLAKCLAGLLQPPEASGSVRLGGRELLGAPAEVLRALRWSTVALSLQGCPFNPVVRIGASMAEPLVEHRDLSRADARRRVDELAADVLLDPALLERYPHQLSVGQRRLAALAMVFSLDPELVVLDEPTIGLDPATAGALIDRVRAKAAERGFALIVCSHDLPAAARLADETVVLYAGQVMEAGRHRAVLGDPAHPYTWALVNAYPGLTTTKDLRPIRGQPPDARAMPTGCPFHPRCTQSEAVCTERPVTLRPSRGRDVACHFGGLRTVLSGTGLTKTFRMGRTRLPALRGASVSLRHGEAIAIVGASGSGKSTLARILTGHLEPDAGDVRLDGEVLASSFHAQDRQRRRRVQLVAQDPWDALSSRLTVRELVREPLDIARQDDRQARDTAVGEALTTVGLPASGTFLDARTHELSGGQLQRVALARALIARPSVLVADEPTSMLDASEQARLLVVLRDAQLWHGLALVIVSHDLGAVRKIADRILVLDAGQIVEDGPSHVVASAPRSDAGRRLLDAVQPLIPTDPLVPTESGSLIDERSG